jgi:hypothetical protein
MRHAAVRNLFRPGSHAFALALSGVLIAFTFFPPAVRATALDGAWAEYDPPQPFAGPDGRTSFPMIHDTARDRLLVFSGDPGPKNDVLAFSLAPGVLWTKLKPAGVPPLPRYGASAIYDPVNDRMIVFGGYTYYPGSMLNDVWELSLSGTPTWTQLAPAGIPPTPRQDVAAVYDPSGQRMILFGGYRASGGFTNEAWSLSLSGTPTWTQLSPSGVPPSARNVFGFAYDSSRDRLLIHGGWNGTYLSDTWTLDLSAGGAWSQLATATSPPARRQSYADYDPDADRLVMFGGYDGGNRDDVWQLNLAGTPDWIALAAAGTPPSPRHGGRGIYDALRRRFVICGGDDNAYRIDVHALALDGAPSWTRLYSDDPIDSPHPAARRDYSLAIDPATSETYLFGGTRDFFYDYLHDRLVPVDTDALHRLPLASLPMRWQELLPTGTPPSARHGHRAVWDPVRHRMLVFGGYDGAYRNDLWALNPYPSPSWQPISTLGSPPDGRMLFGMVFDTMHDRLVVVGGHSGFPPNGILPYRNDAWELPLGGPGALTWAPLSPAGTPPAPRWIYDMVYDAPRHRALLFGGVTEVDRPNDVWALELGGAPAWSALTPAGTPPPGRSDHAMVFDPANDRLVIFGGYTGEFMNDVWSLALSPFPQWSELHPDGAAPVERDIIHAVYDPLGARMVTYGGWDGRSLRAETWALEWSPGVVPIAASLVESHAEQGLVRLAWFVADAASVTASVERREGAGTWLTRGAPERTAMDRLSYEDRDVVAGSGYAYRLRLRAHGEETVTDAAEIELPAGYTLELAGAQPNPVVGERLMVAFTLPARGSARLDLMDLSGRRVASRDLSALGAGRHRVELGEGAKLAPGVYVVRLGAGERTLTRKAFVIR